MVFRGNSHWRDWHPIFALFPRSLDDGRIVWLQTIERRRDPTGMFLRWNYRLPA